MQKYRKHKKCSLYCVCPVVRTVWHLFSKNIKNSFFFSFSVCLTLTSCDTYFQLIQRYQKIKKFSKYKNINIFKWHIFLELRGPWFSTVRYVGARLVLVRFTSNKNQIIFSIVFQISFKELRNLDFSSWMRIRRTKVNPCRVQKIKKIFLFLLVLFVLLFFWRKITFWKPHQLYIF